MRRSAEFAVGLLDRGWSRDIQSGSVTRDGDDIRCSLALEAELGLEAQIDQRAHLRRGEIHERGVAPESLERTRLGAAPERLHLLFHLQHDPAPEGFAKTEFPGQR